MVKTETTKQYDILCGVGFSHAIIKDGKWKGFPLALLFSLQDKILSGEITKQQIKKRGWTWKATTIQ